MKLLLLVALALLALSTNAFAQQSSREDFKEFCGLMKGRWVADVTFTADFPGIGKQGDKVTGYFDVKLDADGHALIGRHYVGAGAGIWTIAYNAADKRIAGLYVDTAGTHENITYYKKDGTWMESGSGSLGDGKKEEWSSSMTFSDKGAKLVLAGTGTIDGKSTDKRNDTYTRVKN